jgi:cytochrome o ubiquinol oxidase operon protein cyoD
MNGHGTEKSYMLGFLASVALTLTAFYIVNQHVTSAHEFLTHRNIILIITGLAITQLIVQLQLFLHLGSESKPRWNLMAALFAAMVVVILVFGSLWIMKNLNYNMTPPTQTDEHIMNDEEIHK